MNLEIYDTKIREKVPLTPSKGDTIRMYTCGPTVYNFAHVGNLRTYIFEDLLRRTIKFFGMKIFHVMNLTDIDDKTIKGSIAQGVPLLEYTKKYSDAFFEDLKTLAIEKAEVYPAATDHIDQMIEMIQTLIEKKMAYVADGDVFFRIAAFKGYGKLSHLCLDDLKVGASNRISSDEYEKESLSDFVLWKGYDPERDGDVKWPSPWGYGRPGWHIECSAMAIHYLGETLDLHVGGIDNMFPHHENEIAQSEGCTNKEFAKHWMHSAHLLVDGRKMSKSLGNFYTLRDLLSKGYTGREVRYLLLSTHYRAQLNFTFQGLDAARQSLARIDDFLFRLEESGGKEADQLGKLILHFEGEVRKFLGDDLNISGTLGALFEFIRAINSLADDRQIGESGKEKILKILKHIDAVLGVLFIKEEEIPAEIIDAANRREEARKEKNWALADQIRKELESKGYFVQDTDGSARVKRK
jgi:cysteinyl-tRNA synthetase